MDEHLTALLDELHAHGVEHDAGQPDRLDRLRNLEPDTARLLALLVRATGARRLLELGTSNGYSTLWLADAVRATGGRIVSVELDPGRSAQAARNLDRAGLSSFVELRLQDAADALRDSPEEGESARELVVVRNNQRVFSEVVELYLRRIDFAPDGYAQLIRLPQYRVAEVTVDPDHSFGRPRFTRGGAMVDDVLGLFRAGEPVAAVAGEFGLSRDEVEDAIRAAVQDAVQICSVEMRKTVA